jgi:adenine-specific DNA-methyltransferase
MKIDFPLAPDTEVSSTDRTRALGSYYTPDVTARAISAWAVRTGDEIILEPSAGAGALLRAAFERANIVSDSPSCKATAYDVDPIAIQNLSLLEIEGISVNLGDFLDISPSDLMKFDLILANPPFNRNHSILLEQRTKLRTRFKTFGAIGLWGHFIVHSLDFLRRGGRLASIVPRSVLFTKHGEKFLSRLCEQFISVQICEFSTRPSWSNFAEETGAVILAEGFGFGPCQVYTRGVLNDDGSITPVTPLDCEYYSAIKDKSIELKDIATLSIGVVTGRNKVFLLSEAERVNAGLALTDVRHVVSRSRQLAGITLTIDEIEKLGEVGHKTWLVAPSEMNKATKKYLALIPEADIKTVVWFRKRIPWWKVQIAESYHAIFTYMNDCGPRIVSLEPGIICTNTLHRVTYLNDTSRELIIASLLTPLSTFGQLEAERLGRKYSGGMLKFELAEARRIPVLVNENLNEGLLKKVDFLLKDGDLARATDTIDEAIMPSIFGESWQRVKNKLEFDLLHARNARRTIRSQVK